MPTPADNLVVLWDRAPIEGFTAPNRGMREALARLGARRADRQVIPLTRFAARFAAKLGLIRNLARLADRRLVMLSWASDMKAFPDSYICENIPWIYDCWGQQWPRWEALLRRHRTRLAFFSARQNAEYFAKAIPGLTTHWLPEALDLTLLRPGKPLIERTQHVFEMGRRLASIHDKIRDPLKAEAKSHIYQIDPRRHNVIPGLDNLYASLGDSATMICYPKVMSHPDGAGGVETLTQRYIESIGSGALTIGHCPAELQDLFGFNPVIELSTTDPAGHLLDVLANLASYQPLIDKSLARVKEVGSFDIRAKSMLEAISAFDAANR